MISPSPLKIPGRFLAAVAAMFFTVAPLRAEVWFSWGSEVYSTLIDSYGNPLDASYTFELGAFDSSFTPTADNVELWPLNWKVFDRTQVVVNPDPDFPTDYFRSEAFMLEDGLSTGTDAAPGYDFRGRNAYMWGYNTNGYSQTLEWVWFRSPRWVFPASVDPGPALTPTDWSVSQLVVGNVAPVVPLWGRQTNFVGLGFASAPTSVNTLQTYTLQSGPSAIPEPSTIIAAVLLLGIALFQRWRRVRAAKSAAVLAVIAGFSLPAQATQINFYSSPGVPAFGSNGQPLNEDTYFEVGVFANGFVPSATNTAQWSANWRPAQRTKFTTMHNWFTSIFNVTNNTAPFTAGAPAYVWGFSGSEAQGQWLLFRATNWNWPTANDTAPVPLLWSAKDANVVIVGSLPPASAGAVSLRPTAIANSLPPVTKWAQFKADKMPDAVLGNPSDDADGDGVANILEFALGTAPNNSAERPASPGTWNRLARGGDGKDYLEVRVPRRRDRAVNFSAELSSDLAAWSGGTNAVDTVENTVEALTLRDKTPIGEGGTQRFMRVKAVPAP